MTRGILTILSAITLTSLTSLGADSTPVPEPDYKALYLKANDSARLWKEKAEALEARAQKLSDMLLLANGRAAAAQKELAAKRNAGQDEQAAIDKEKAEKADLVAHGTTVQLCGRIVSITSDGMIVKNDNQANLSGHYHSPYPRLAQDCYVEMDTTGFHSNDFVDLNVVEIGDYDYVSPHAVNRRICRAVFSANNIPPY